MLSLAGLFLLLAGPACGRQVVVTSVGAVPDDGKDDTAAVQKALDAARGTGNLTLVFPPGRYDFFSNRNGAGGKTALLFRDLDGLEVQGNASEIVCHGIMAGFAFRNCSNVLLRDFVFDYERPPFSVGEVLATDGRTMVVKVWDEFPVEGGEEVQAFMEYDPATRTPLKRGLDVYNGVSRTELVGPQLLKLYLKREIWSRSGRLLILRHQVYGCNAVSFSECAGAALRNVTIYTCPGMGVTAQAVSDIDIRMLSVRPRPGTNRIMSTTADATHFNGCYGRINVQDCYFEGMGDDAVNVHGMYHVVEKILDPNTVVTRCRNDWLKPPRVGDVVEFTDSETLLSSGQSTVLDVELNGRAKRHRIRLKDPLPAGFQEGDALGIVSWAPSLRIAGCTVKNNRARGMLIQTRSALVERNRFIGSSGAALHITCDLDYWTESISTRDITIRNNTFEDCNYGAAMTGGVLHVFADSRSKSRPPAGVHRGIVVEGNTFRRTDNSAVFISSASDVVIRGNLIDAACADPTMESGRAAVYLENVSGARILRNTFRPAPAKVVLGHGCDAGSVQIKGNRGL